MPASDWTQLDASARKARQQLREKAAADVEACAGWRCDGNDSAGKWHAHGPRRAHIVADTPDDLVRRVRAAAAGSVAPTQGVLL